MTDQFSHLVEPHVILQNIASHQIMHPLESFVNQHPKQFERSN